MKRYFFLLFSLFPVLLSAQTITGKVTDTDNKALVGANIYWINTTMGTTSDETGAFDLSSEGIEDKQLIISFVGYQSDTLLVTNQSEIVVQLNEFVLNNVVVTGNRFGIYIPTVAAAKTEIISKTELKKAACCDLAGCFETQITVQPQTTNVVTNAKELRILGLSGVYNQVLVDGFPMIQGLSYTYGISSIPGTLVDNIYVAKGANSVLQGYESISGQVNVITADPATADKLFLNVYANSFLEKQFNAHSAFKKNKWSNVTAFHAVLPAKERDKDEDTFLDLPQLNRYMVMNKWSYGDPAENGLKSTMAVRFLKEKRVGGQVNFDPKTDKGSNEIYGQTVDITQPEMWAKIGYRFNENQAIRLKASAFFQDQNSYFGTAKYDAQQANVYANLQFDQDYAKVHNVKMGLSHRFLNLEEDIVFTDETLPRTYDGNYQRTEHISGIFAENSMQFLNNKMNWMLGMRVDYHNEFGLQFTPRTLLKYDVTDKMTLRGSVGKGWRTVNLFSENTRLLVSSRDIVFVEDLQPEEAWNYGVNVTQKFDNELVSGYVSADYYRTDFQNQIFPDYDSDPTKAIVQNFTETSVSNGFQVEAFVNIWERFDVKMGYNYLDVYRMVSEAKEQLPFNAKHKFLTTLSYRPLSDKFHIDMNVHWYGKKRLPNTANNPTEFQRPDFSEAYSLLAAQFTYNFKQFEFYTGCENIFDFRLEQPILSWEDPFSPYFDTSSVWGPTRGREFYLGVRFALAK